MYMNEKTKGGIIGFLIGLIVLIIVIIISGNNSILWILRIVSSIITIGGLYIAVQGYLEQREQNNKLDFESIKNKRFGQGDYGIANNRLEREELLRKRTYQFPPAGAPSVT